MKKLLAIIVIVCACAVSHAQTLSQQGSLYVYTSALDTNTNATTSYLYFNGIPGHVKSMQLTVTKISGTVAGTVIIDASNDGVAWVPAGAGDTLTLANQASNSGLFPFTGTYYKSYRARFTTTGTQVSSLLATLVRRQDE